PCPGWSVRDVMNHSIGVTMKFADFAAGGSDHPRTPPGDLVGRDHRLALRSAAWAVIGPGRDPRQYAPEIPVAAAASPGSASWPSPAGPSRAALSARRHPGRTGGL